MFGGDEIKRPHARRFIGLLRGLALDFKLTVLLLTHPSLSGMSSGAGTSGSTGWSNSVRSRLYLVRPPGADDDDDGDTRVLTTKKSNYGRVGAKRVLRWQDGVFVLDSGARADKLEANAEDDRTFLAILADFARSDRAVSDKKSSTFAPPRFAEHPSAKGLSVVRLNAAMQRLFAASRIHNVTSGPPSETAPAHCCGTTAGIRERDGGRPMSPASNRLPTGILTFQPPPTTLPTTLPTGFRHPTNRVCSNPPYPPGGWKPPFGPWRPQGGSPAGPWRQVRAKFGRRRTPDMTLVIGIDIGATCALALVDESGELIAIAGMPVLNDGPAARRAVNAPLLAAIVMRWGASRAFVELVGARPGEGAVGAFAFGRSRGVVEGVLAACVVPATHIAPAAWKRAVESLRAGKGPRTRRGRKLSAGGPPRRRCSPASRTTAAPRRRDRHRRHDEGARPCRVRNCRAAAPPTS